MVVNASTAVADQAATGQQVSHKVELLRNEMAKADDGKGVHAYIIPTEDPHMVCVTMLHATITIDLYLLSKLSDLHCTALHCMPARVS